MYPLDSLLHLCWIILFSESLKDVQECLWRRINLLNLLILLLLLFFELIFPLFLCLHYRLLYIIHHLIRLWNGAVIVIDGHDLTLLFSHVHVDDSPDLYWFVFNDQSIIEEVIIITKDRWLVVRGIKLTLRLLLDWPSPHCKRSVEVLITKVVVKIWKRVLKRHHEVFFIRKCLFK